MKPTSWNSIPRVFFRFAPIGKVEKTRFERNWTTFVNPAFCPAWKSPLKMMVWNRPRGIRSQGCFFASPRLGKSKKRVLNRIRRRSSTRLFALLRKAHSKWWYETDLVEFDPKGVFSYRPDWESRKNAFWTQFDDVRQFDFLRCLEKPTQNSGMKPTSWISIPRVFFRFAPIGKVEKRVLNSIWRYSWIRLLALLGKTHPKWWYETDLVEFDPKGVFSFRPDGESRKTRFELNLTMFVNSTFCAAWKSPPKIVVWNRRRGFRSQGCFFVSPRWGKSKNAFWTQFDDIRDFGFLRVLDKTHPKWWYETDLVEFDPNGVFSFRPDGESRKTRFELNLTMFVNSTFCAAWKSPPKIVVWNRRRGFRSQGCFFVSPRWGKSKNAFWTQFDDIREFGFLRCLEKPTQNGGMKPTTWNSIPTVFFRFAPMGKVENRVLNSIWRCSSIRLFALLGKAHQK